jgi:hypothetical protein
MLVERAQPASPGLAGLSVSISQTDLQKYHLATVSIHTHPCTMTVTELADR